MSYFLIAGKIIGQLVGWYLALLCVTAVVSGIAVGFFHILFWLVIASVAR
jgi:hypothetical protein